MNPLKILLSILKTIGKASFRAELTKSLKRTTPARWAELAVSFDATAIHAHNKDAEEVAAELTDVLFSIKP